MLLHGLIKALEQNKVKYALVGGYAVALHGAVRGTVDVDIVIALTEKSFHLVEKSLQELGMTPRLPITADEVFHFREEYIKNKNLIAWSFYNPKDATEIVDILITEDVRKIKTVTKKVYGLNVKIASIPDLITMKKKSNRPQDKQDIKALEKML